VLTRRDFLSRSALVALTPTVPTFLARTARAATPQRDGRVLVVLQLDGGNDGINTVVPFADEGYARQRKQLRLPLKDLIKLDNRVGLHPQFRDAARLLESQRLAIVQGVGYPNPNRSHAASMAIWHTARFDPEEHNGLGWVGRALDGAGPRAAGEPASLFVGPGTAPVALRGRRSAAAVLDRLDDFRLAEGAATGVVGAEAPASDLEAFLRRSMLDAYTTADRLKEVGDAGEGDSAYPATTLAGRLRLVARLLKTGLAARVYYTTQGSYDTHAVQLPTHANLLRELGGALRAFLDDLAAAGLADRVVVLAFSEFGRTVKENASAGTDHGTAGPVFLAGPAVRAGLIGTMPSLLDLDPRYGDLRTTADFRQVYATVLEDWLRLPARPALGGTFGQLPLFQANIAQPVRGASQ
jgi:uncharacterized protein (DUF1501 family)